MKRPSKLAQAVAAVVIALFWCINAIGTVGVTSLATAVSAVTPAHAGERRRNKDDGNRRRRRRQSRRRQRRRRGDNWEWYWAPYWQWDYY
jgi:hypothetical protein